MFLPSAPAEAAIAALLCCALLCFALPSLSSGQSCWCFVGPPYSSTMYFPPQHASSRSMRPRATAALPPPYRRFRRAQNLHGDIVRPRSRACLSCGDSLSLFLIVPLGIRGDHTSRPAAEIDRRCGRFRPQACLQCSSPILATPEPMVYAGLAQLEVWSGCRAISLSNTCSGGPQECFAAHHFPQTHFSFPHLVATCARRALEVPPLMLDK